MNKKPILSVIIPLYNAELTIERCLDSLLNQTLKGIEIIVVNDASSDRGMEIALSYQEMYSNVIVLNNEQNLGAGATKNIGIQHANADLLGFCDADDYVDTYYFERLYQALNKFDADVACSDTALVYKDKIEYLNILEGNLYNTTKNKGKARKKNATILSLEEAVAHCVSASAATKIFKKNIVSAFFEGACDDLAFTYPALTQAKKIVYVPDNYYYYVQNENSLERSNFKEGRLTLGDCLSSTLEQMRSDSRGLEEAEKLIFAFSSWGIIFDILKDYSNREQYLSLYYDKLLDKRLLKENDYLDAILLTKSFGEQRLTRKIIDSFLERRFETICELYDEFGKCPEYYLPKVSIVIPVYNGSNYLKEAIMSALSQNYPNYEIIVVNDGSKDGGKTEAIAKSFGNRIRYYYKSNGGVASALNYGIKQMQGEYFSWLSHDDLYKPDKISRQIEELRLLQDKRTIVISGYDVVNANCEKQYEVSPLNIYRKELLETPLYAVFHGCINGCATLIHKSHFDQGGMFDEALPTTQDYDLWFRIMRGKKICFSAYNGVLSRVHGEQDSKRLYDKHLKECNHLWVRLLKMLTENEMKEMSGSVIEFYLDEKKFFEQLPYKKVTHYLEGKIIDHIRDSWIAERTGRHNVLSKTLGIEAQFTALEDIKLLAKRNQAKVAILNVDQNMSIEEIELSTKTVENALSKTCLRIMIGQDKLLVSSVSNNEIITYPFRELNDLPYLLKVLNIVTIIYFSAGTYSMKAFNTRCSAMGIEVVSWNRKKHWILRQDQTVVDKLEEYLELENVDVSVWSDRDSFIVSSYNKENSIYIPFAKCISELDYISSQWKQLLGKDACELKKMQIVEEGVNELIQCIVENVKNSLLYQATHIEHKVEEVDRVVYVENDATEWKSKYDNIANSTTWRLTKPLRTFVDLVKKIVNYI